MIVGVAIEREGQGVGVELLLSSLSLFMNYLFLNPI